MKSLITLLAAVLFCKQSYAQVRNHSLRNRHLILAAEEWMPYFGFTTDPDDAVEPHKQAYKGIMIDVLRSDLNKINYHENKVRT